MSAFSLSRVPSNYSYSHNGVLIQKLREKYGLTQEKLAERIGVDAKTVRRWEVGDVDFGKVSICTARRIADVFGMDFGAIASPDGDGDSPLFFGHTRPLRLTNVIQSVTMIRQGGPS